MQILTGNKFLLEQEDFDKAKYYAELMDKGFVSARPHFHTSSYFDTYLTGKIGEMVFNEWALRKGMKLIHTPFRQDYSKFVKEDDFIVELPSGKQKQIEIKTKARIADPQLNFDCSFDSILPYLTYVFLSWNKKTDIVSLIGKADWQVLRQYAKIEEAGFDNGQFVRRFTEFNIYVKHLIPLEAL